MQPTVEGGREREGSEKDHREEESGDCGERVQRERAPKDRERRDKVGEKDGEGGEKRKRVAARNWWKEKEKESTEREKAAMRESKRGWRKKVPRARKENGSMKREGEREVENDVR